MASRASGSGTPASSNMTRPGLTTATQPSGEPLPDPMRVSAGFLVTGLSGKTLIHTLPPRLILRVIATRAASIWRLVSQPPSSALSPYSPSAWATVAAAPAAAPVTPVAPAASVAVGVRRGRSRHVGEVGAGVALG